MSFQLLARKLPDSAGAVDGPVGVRVRREAPTGRDARSAPPAVALQVADLSKGFRSGFLRRPLRGIEGVSFTVNRGAVFALLGHNGAGKTTTINCILDLVHPDRGDVRILGCDHRDCAARRGVGYLPERPYFFEHLTGRELLRFYAELLDVPRGERTARIARILDQVGIAEAADRPLRKFSKGMLQRIGLGQTLLGDPEILILDEPMSGLDPMGRRQVRELLLDLKHQGKTIILSSHIVPDVETLADTVGVLREGRLVLTRDLAGRGVVSAYDVRLACGPGRLAGFVGADRPLPTWAPDATRSDGRGGCRIEAADVSRLRELLDACHRAGLPVESVEPCRSDLEDIFLQAHAQGAAT